MVYLTKIISMVLYSYCTPLARASRINASLSSMNERTHTHCSHGDQQTAVAYHKLRFYSSAHEIESCSVECTSVTETLIVDSNSDRLRDKEKEIVDMRDRD